MNRRRGKGYRDHSRRSRPPLKTARGNLAADHDDLVREWMAFARCMRAAGEVHWTMENPVGSLARRDYMQPQALEALGGQLVNETVDYCAYGREDMKPTHLWTTLAHWRPVGVSGDGRCQGPGSCHAIDGTRHRASVTGGKRKRGRRMHSKSAVPRALHWELLVAMQVQVTSTGHRVTEI